MSIVFLDETVIDERAVRRLARSCGATVALQGDSWVYNGVELDSDEVWDVLSTLPVVSF